MTADQLRHAQMAGFCEFYAPPSTIKRLTHYYSRRGRPLPRFADFAAPDAESPIVRSGGPKRKTA